MQNKILTCVLLTNEAETQYLCLVGPKVSLLFVYQYVDKIRNLVDQGVTVTFIENLFPEDKRVQICLSQFVHFLPIFGDILSSNCNLVDLRPQVLYIFEKLLAKYTRKLYHKDECLQKSGQNIFVNMPRLRCAHILTLCPQPP